MLDWIGDELLKERLISPDDLDLLSITDDPEEAVETVVACYERRCAHSPAEPAKEIAE